MAIGMPDEARKVFDQYLNDFPDNAFIRYCSAVQYFCRGEFELAQAEADRALSLAPDNYVYVGLKGMIYGRQGNLAAAEKGYEKLLQLDEPVARVSWLSGMGNLRLLEGRIVESQDLLEKAVESVRQAEEKDWECYFLFRSAFNHLLLGAPQKALALMDRMWALSSEWESDFWQMMALHIRGIAALKMKDRDGALKAADELKKFIDGSMYEKEIRQYDHLLGLIELEKNNLPQAVKYLEKAVALLPGQFNFYGGSMEMHAFYLDSLARAYFQAGDLQKAKAEYERITSLTTGRLHFGDIYAKSFFMLGKIAEQQGDKTKAIERYGKFLDLWKNADPGLAEVEDARKRLAGLGSS
jgi:tetratricopeptide (TPR) repeat protein